MKPKKRGLPLRLIWWCSFAVFVVSTLLIGYYLIQSAIHKRDMADMAAYVRGADGTAVTAEAPRQATAQPMEAAPTAAQPATTAQPAAAQSTPPEPTPLSTQDEALLQRLAALARENPDFIGWLSVEGTGIDDPVMHTPDDSQHYLNRDFSGAYSTAGQLFLDGSCDTDDAPGNKIVYGHNMRDGTRFSDLKRYLDEAFLLEQPYIRFDTLHSRGVYQVMAAFVIHVEQNDASQRLCYQSIDTTDDAALDQLRGYLDEYAETRAQDAQPQLGDELLTLSTCGRSGTNERVIVMARRVEGEL